MKLEVIYRAYPGEDKQEDFKSFRPEWFDKVVCAKSLFDQVKYWPDTKLTIVWDGPTKSNNLLNYLSSKFQDNIIYNKEFGNINSLLKCYELGLNSEADYLLFTEDDFLYLADSYNTLKELFFISPFVSLFDHMDRYRFMRTDITFGKEYIFDGDFGTYRTAESTTQTFGIKKDYLVKFYDTFVNFAKAGDGAPDDRGLWRHLAQRENRLLTPIVKDSKSAHLVKDTYTEKIDWKARSEEIKWKVLYES